MYIADTIRWKNSEQFSNKPVVVKEMKRVTLFISTALTLLLLAQPILPYIEYLTFKDFIIEQLCVNREIPESCCKGKCYLNKKVKEANQENQSDSNVPRKKKTERLTFLISSCSFRPIKKNDILVYGMITANHYSFTFHNVIFHPPNA